MVYPVFLFHLPEFTGCFFSRPTLSWQSSRKLGYRPPEAKETRFSVRQRPWSLDQMRFKCHFLILTREDNGSDTNCNKIQGFMLELRAGGKEALNDI